MLKLKIKFFWNQKNKEKILIKIIDHRLTNLSNYKNFLKILLTMKGLITN
jgi:hypothetical protein